MSNTQVLQDLMTKYNENLAKWIEVNGSDVGFNDWFTTQVMGR